MAAPELTPDEFGAAVAAVTSAFGDPTRRDIYLFVRASEGAPPLRSEAGADAGPACPVTAGTAPVVSVSAGAGRSCALRSDGTVKCWGFGPLGDGTSDMRSSPQQVPCLAGIKQISVSINTCAIREDGAILCWGDNDNGEVGIGVMGSPALVPTVVAPATDLGRG